VLCGGLGFQQVGQLHKLGGGRRTDASLSAAKRRYQPFPEMVIVFDALSRTENLRGETESGDG